MARVEHGRDVRQGDVLQELDNHAPIGLAPRGRNLERARSWPGTANITDVESGFNVRSGDVVQGPGNPAPTDPCCRFPSVFLWHTLIISGLEAYFSIINAINHGHVSSFASWVFNASAWMESIGFLFALVIMALTSCNCNVIDSARLGSGGSPLLMVWEANFALDGSRTPLMSTAVYVGFALQAAAIWVYSMVLLSDRSPVDAIALGISVLAACGVVLIGFKKLIHLVHTRLAQAERRLVVTGRISYRARIVTAFRSFVQNGPLVNALILLVFCLQYVVDWYQHIFVAPLVVEVIELVLIFAGWSSSTSDSIVLAVLDLILVVSALPQVCWFLWKPLNVVLGIEVFFPTSDELYSVVQRVLP
ncbi:unnamed protein product [Ectocarpus sp. 13 AM-2016]